MPEGVARHALSRDLQHRRAEIDPSDARGFWQEPEFEASADADDEYFGVRARGLAGRARGGEPTRAERQVEDEVIDRRPTAIRGVRLVLKPDPGACCARSRHDGDPLLPENATTCAKTHRRQGSPAPIAPPAASGKRIPPPTREMLIWFVSARPRAASPPTRVSTASAGSHVGPKRSATRSRTWRASVRRDRRTARRTRPLPGRARPGAAASAGAR